MLLTKCMFSELTSGLLLLTSISEALSGELENMWLYMLRNSEPLSICLFWIGKKGLRWGFTIKVLSNKLNNLSTEKLNAKL